MGGNTLYLVATSWLTPANPQHITDHSRVHDDSAPGEKNIGFYTEGCSSAPIGRMGDNQPSTSTPQTTTSSNTVEVFKVSTYRITISETNTHTKPPPP